MSRRLHAACALLAAIASACASESAPIDDPPPERVERPEQADSTDEDWDIDERFEPLVADSALADSGIVVFGSRARARKVFTEASHDLMEDPESLVLFSISPSVYRDYGYGADEPERDLPGLLKKLRDPQNVLGSLDIVDRGQMGAIVGGVYHAMVETGPPAGCFDPRHAVVFQRGDEEVAALICFACHYIVPLEADSSSRKLRSFGDPDKELSERLNKLLTDARIPLGKW